MSTSVVPALIDALVEACTTALEPLDFDVTDGFSLSFSQADELAIGVDDPFSDDRADSASTTQTAATMGTARSRDEEGTIRCAAVATDGGGDPKTARDRVYAATAAVETLLRGVGNPAFGVPGVRAVGFGSNSTLYQDQTEKDGASALLVFDVAFVARI